MCGVMMQSEAEKVAMRLTEDLRAGHFTPGSWLKQVDLQERYDAGRASVRKALELLAGRQLIRHEKNRGYSVYPEDNALSEQILAIRLAIETGFAETICANATTAQIDQLRQLANDFETISSEGTFHRLYRTNLEFHRALLACAKNKPMVDLVEELRMRTAPAPVTTWVDRTQITRSAREHHLIVDALERRDDVELARLIRGHILANISKAGV